MKPAAKEIILPIIPDLHCLKTQELLTGLPVHCQACIALALSNADHDPTNPPMPPKAPPARKLPSTRDKYYLNPKNVW